MVTFQTVEDQIKNDYNIVDSFIMLHPKLSVVCAILLAGLLGHFI